jgi:hypothetical protein
LVEAWYPYTDFGEGRDFLPTMALHHGSDRRVDAVLWSCIVAVLDPWPHEGTAVILGQAGFLDRFTVTFGPEGFAVEAGSEFTRRFGRVGQ